MKLGLIRRSRISMLAMILGAAAAAGAAYAKLPDPSPEAKAKSAEGAARSAWGNKVADFQLCKAQDRVAASYQANKKVQPAAAGPAAPAPAACADPGAFVYAPPEPPKPLEAAGAHSPPKTASEPPNTKSTDAELKAGAKK